MASISPALPFQSVSRGTIREVVAGKILTAVMQGDFPAGQRMVVQGMSEQLGVSATPIREALFELASIGIVEILPNRGAIMREFGPKQLREIYQLRRVLEVESIRCSFGRIDPDQLRELREEMLQLTEASRDSQWSERAMEIDVRLHALITDRCGSARLKHELERYNTLVQVVREVVDNELKAQEIAIDEHLQILDELLQGDIESSAEAMARHIDSTAQVIEEAMFQDRISTPTNGSSPVAKQ